MKLRISCSLATEPQVSLELLTPAGEWVFLQGWTITSFEAVEVQEVLTRFRHLHEDSKLQVTGEDAELIKLT